MVMSTQTEHLHQPAREQANHAHGDCHHGKVERSVSDSGGFRPDHDVDVDGRLGEVVDQLAQRRVKSQPTRYKFLESCTKVQKEVLLSFLAAGGFEALRSWVMGETSASTEEIGEAIDLLTKR